MLISVCEGNPNGYQPWDEFCIRRYVASRKLGQFWNTQNFNWIVWEDSASWVPISTSGMRLPLKCWFWGLRCLFVCRVFPPVSKDCSCEWRYWDKWVGCPMFLHPNWYFDLFIVWNELVSYPQVSIGHRWLNKQGLVVYFIQSFCFWFGDCWFVDLLICWFVDL